MSWNAKSYENYVAPLTRSFIDPLLRSCKSRMPPRSSPDDSSGVDFLDVCCGTGVASEVMESTLSPLSYTYTGVDLDPVMVAFAAEERNLTTFHSDVCDMKVVRDDDRDCAFSNFGVIFAGDVAMGVKEMARVVKGNGGVVGATAWAEKECTEVFQMFGDALEKVTGERKSKGRCSVDALVRAFKRAGLKDVRKEKVKRYLIAKEGKQWVWDRFTKSSNGLRERIEKLSEEGREMVRELVYQAIDEVGERIEEGSSGSGCGYKFPVSAYIVTGVKSNLELVSTARYSVVGVAGKTDWVRVEEDVKARILHPSYVCYLCTEGIRGNVMTVSWYSLVNERGDFIMTVSKRRFTCENLVGGGRKVRGRLCVVRKGDEEKCKRTGRGSGGRGEIQQGRGWSDKVRGLVAEGVIRIGNLDGGIMKDVDVEREEPRDDWIVKETDAFVSFSVDRVIEEDEERMSFGCRVVEGWVKRDMWDGRRFIGEGLVFRGGGEFG